MIPYDDLVAALQAWRARQGLPVNTLGGVSAAPAVPNATPGSGPGKTAGSGPKTAPPAPPKGTSNPGIRPPMPLAAPGDDDHEEVEEAAMLGEEAYENEGDDFAMSFGSNSSTEIGGAPERPSEQTDPTGGRRTNRNDDW